MSILSYISVRELDLSLERKKNTITEDPSHFCIWLHRP